MAKLLPNPVIQAIYKAAVAAHLDRTTLLASLPPALTSSLPRAEQPGAQILTGLLRFNQIDRLADATVPLREWLETAELLAGPLAEGAVFRDALRQLDAATPAGAGPRVEPPAAGHRAREQALGDLLLTMFSADELRRLIRYLPDGRDLEAELPGPTAALAALVHAVVEVLGRRGALGREFFAALIAERPRRRAEIEPVQRLFHP